MHRSTKLAAAGLTLTVSLFALVEASGAPQPQPSVTRPVVLAPNLAPLRPIELPHVRGGVLPPHVRHDAGTKPADAGAPVATDAGSAPVTKAFAALTAAQKSAFIAKINSLRASLGAASMQPLVWDDQLARFASTVAGQCELSHSSAAERTNITSWIGTYVGENVAGGAPAALVDATNAAKVSADLDFALTLWWNEKTSYDYATNTCAPGRVCGHFTQVAWAQTKAVGCAVVMCTEYPTLGSAYSVACEFAPGGNIVGQKPY